MYYFKMWLLFFICLDLGAQIKGTTAEIDEHLKTKVENTEASSIQNANDLTQAGWKNDEDNDEIFILDAKIRSKLRDSLKTKATTVYDNEKSGEAIQTLVKEKVLQVENFEEYKTEDGDTLQKISQKLYGTTKRWRELQLLNEDKLPNENIRKGMVLKYRPMRN